LSLILVQPVLVTTTFRLMSLKIADRVFVLFGGHFPEIVLAIVVASALIPCPSVPLQIALGVSPPPCFILGSVGRLDLLPV
jgi:hypothetical protein